MRKRIVPIVAFLAVGSAHSAAAQGKRPMTFEDFAAVRVVGDPQLSPDGRSALYAVRTTDVDANTRATATYMVALTGGAPRPFPDASAHASDARWSPDGRSVVYVSGDQLWIADASGANSRQLAKLAGGASGPVWAPSGNWIAFISRVYPSCMDDACNAARQQAIAKSKVKAHVIDQLMYRHWTQYDDSTRGHLFVVAPNGSGLHDVTPGVRYDIPPGPFGGSEGYTFSPDGKELAYTAKDQGREDAWSTDLNVYTVPVQGGTPVVITASNRGADENPVYSPDGRTILYHSQERAGFESDQRRLMIYDRTTHTTTRLAPAWDRDADSYTFSPDGHTIFIQTVDHAREKIYELPERGTTWDVTPTLLISGHSNTSLSLSKDGRTFVWMRDAIDHPPEAYTGTWTGSTMTGVHAFTHENDALVAQLQLNAPEEFWFKGALGDSVQGFTLKPPQYEPGKKFPVMLIIHGGPQSSFLDSWHPRWNFSMFAAGGGGFAIVFMNPHASPGYGQKFVDEVSKDWGGATYKDLMIGLDTALARNVAWMDTTHVGAAGASYGGYMVNWIAGHTTRFKALFTHDGLFNLENFYGATEELWFPEWEFGGPYWDKHAMETQYRVWSPHLYAANFRTPHLIVHGALDYRVPLSDGLSLFTALQRQGVPSRLIIFPDEGHFVTKPQNQRLWYREVFAWFEKYLKGT